MTDLRLVPAALASWVAAWLLTGSGAGWTGAVAGWSAGLVAVACAVALAVGPAAGGAPGRSGRRTGVPPRPGVPPCTGRRAPVLAALSASAHAALVGACVLAVAASAHVQLAGRIPLPDLARLRVTGTLVGTVVAQPEPFVLAPGADRYRWVLDARSAQARGVTSPTRARVQVLSASPPRYGATVTVSGPLRPADPGAGEAAALTTDRAHEIRAPPRLLRALDDHRAALLDVTAPLSPQARGLVPGAAIGDTSRLPEEIADDMRVSGLTHVTAVSGGHFAVVVAVLTLLCSVARVPRAARVVLVALAALAFVALVRPEPAVLRAAVMAGFALTGVALGRPARSAPALAGAVVGLLVVDPWLARSYGFVLSAVATGGLVLLAAPLAARLAPWTGSAAAFALAVPTAAQAACGPVLVLLDPSVSTVSVPANLLAAPAVVPATVLGLVATVLAPWLPAVASPVAWAAGCATGWITAVARACASAWGASVPWPAGPPGALLLAAATALVLWAVLRRPPGDGWPESWRAAARSGGGSVRPRAVVLAAAAAAVVLVVVLAVPRLAGRQDIPADWLVAACDVGQGDALALRTGPASAVVADVGPAGDAAGRCLDRLGVSRVDLLVLSHFHADHVGGLPAVLAGREVTAALVSPVAEPAAGAAATYAALAGAEVPVRVAGTGDRGTAGTVGWQVLLAGAGAGANDSSVVLGARTAGLDVVLLGDLEGAGQAELASLVGQADVVKVAHHGSAVQSGELARRLRPAVALVSAGRGNDYGHPTREALSLYAGVGAVVVRTDECGTVALVVRDGQVGLAGC